MSDFKQTWWDKEIKDHFLEFKSWVGDKNAPSKVWARKFVKQNDFKSLIDVGCGNATEYFAYKEEYPELQYTGVDSSRFLYAFNLSKGVPMVLADADVTRIADNAADVAFSRHVLEHQPTFQPVLDELIRIAEKVAIHVFFIPPGEAPEHIGYDESKNLYHNRYNKMDITNHVKANEKVKDHLWVDISPSESALICYL